MKKSTVIIRLLYFTLLFLSVARGQPTWMMKSGRLSVLSDSDGLRKLCGPKGYEPTGVCLTREECVYEKGIPSDTICSDTTFCCKLFTYACTVKTIDNETYVSSPGYPKRMHELGSCEVNIQKSSSEIRQIRIDFIDFNMAPANTETKACDKDRLIVSGGASSDLQVCGPDGPAHLYYRLGDAYGSKIRIKFETNARNYTRRWKIKISQFDSYHQTPAGCIQYFDDEVGTVKLMNFTINGRQQVTYSDYKICIHRAPNVCAIVYETCGDTVYQKRNVFAEKFITPFETLQANHEETSVNCLGPCLSYHQEEC